MPTTAAPPPRATAKLPVHGRPVERGYERPVAYGKFLDVGGHKLYVRGVTYGTFRPGEDGGAYPEPAVVAHDFAQMAEHGINAVRTYTAPPEWLLDLAHANRMYVMVGLPWEQHVTFLDSRSARAAIEQRVREAVASCAEHPGVLCYAVGNEIPAPIVRWHGPRAVARYIERLYEAAKEEDPGGLVTYVNYPSTEYLELPFLDLACFNVYLESQPALDAYLARLHNLAGERPLLMAEIGLDSRRHGEEEQARVLDWQIRTAFGAGCAGAFVFAWTDEWHRGGYDIEDWDFGIVDRERRPKPALDSVANAFAETPLPSDTDWPRISVVVCTYNGAATLDDCLDGLARVRYPDYEVIVVDDGSTDDSAEVAARYGVQVISTENRGLSAARNSGVEAASGDIIAFTDDDARPDPDWLTYLAATFQETSHVAVGGPNIAPPGTGGVAGCVARAPGGPIHVLLSDGEAEHIPGCNSAYRKSALQAVGGFDPRFRVAGDDVDMCWRLQERGWTLGFNPAAMVWHRRRDSVAAYWRHQIGYGRAEALLERKWPERYNLVGHLSWAGRMYGGVSQALARRRGHVRYGTWGTALFQRLYRQPEGLAAALPLMPEWYLLIAVLATVSAFGALWSPLLAALPLLVLATTASVVKGAVAGWRAWDGKDASLRGRVITALLFLIQPAARLRGRLALGLAPWRRRAPGATVLPRPFTLTVWSESWRAPDDRLLELERWFRSNGAAALRGGEFDRWDIELRAGMLAGGRALMAIEEHGGGKQLVRLRVRPRIAPLAWVAIVAASVTGSLALLAGAWAVAAAAGGVALGFAVVTIYAAATAMASFRAAFERPEPEPARTPEFSRYGGAARAPAEELEVR